MRNNILVKEKAMKSIGFFIIGMALVCSLNACKQEEVNKPGKGGEKPGVVSNIQSKSLPGAVSISYKLPQKGAMYVTAEYETRPGSKKSVKASKYNEELLLEGFPEEGEYTVNLYAVGIGEQKSDPVTVTVKVLTPPLVSASKSLKIREDFGGINVSFENIYEGDLSIEVLTTDSVTGKFKTAYTHYTKVKNGSFSVRGYKPVERLFGVTMRDRWTNTTDTSYVTLTPYFEQLLPYDKYTPLFLPTDTYDGHKWGTLTPRDMNFLFDGDNNPASASTFMTKPNGGVMPQHFTFDIGKTAKLSRYKIWMRGDHTFTGAAPLTWELWGSNQPNLDGSWESWTKLSEYTMVKPSGMPLGQNTAEDLAANLAGIEFNLPLTAPPVRYLRFKTTASWSAVKQVAMQEMWFWGEYQQ